MQIEIWIGGRWTPCARVELVDAVHASRHGRVRLRYEADYAVEHLEAFDYRALSVRFPVGLGARGSDHWPSFLLDLLPQGAARKRLERQGPLTEWMLLERGAVNPVGNLRVQHEAPPPRQHPGFELREMIARGDAFIDHANEVGATVAGATDTQGEAPKFWVVQDSSGRWHPDDGHHDAIARRFALLKFPVPEAGARAEDILRHEAAYQRIAAQLGLRVTDELPAFAGGALLIPRFDRRARGVRLGVESLYSICGVLDSSQTTLRHHEALIALSRCVTDFREELREYLQRDLLSLALGNRDNHGRNTAVLKDVDGAIRLAPLFDFGPAFIDARAIARVMRWDGEGPGATDWNHVLDNLVTRFDEAGIADVRRGEMAGILRGFVANLRPLPDLMHACGVDRAIIEQRRPEIERLALELEAVRT